LNSKFCEKFAIFRKTIVKFGKISYQSFSQLSLARSTVAATAAAACKAMQGFLVNRALFQILLL
jgi:hypothetical protein